MNLYNIDAAITALVDPDTGEVLNYEAFAALQMEREEKLENMALWHKNLKAESAALKAEIDNLTERKKDVDKKAERLAEHLAEALGGDPFETPRVVCSFRSSQKVEIPDEDAFIRTMQEGQHFEYLRYRPPEVNRTEVTKAIKAGRIVPGAQLIKKNNLSIK